MRWVDLAIVFTIGFVCGTNFIIYVANTTKSMEKDVLFDLINEEIVYDDSIEEVLVEEITRRNTF